MAGPLAHIRIVEFEGIGPAPHAGMLLADQGAEVVRIVRPSAERGALLADTGGAVLHRGRAAITLDLKAEADVALARRLIAAADGLIEGLRPGVMERLGLGPGPCLEANPRLVYGRVTGWGQEGPLARAPGHDINYIALVGVLGAMGPADGPPVPPLNLVGDFGGGGLWLAFGMLAALIEAGRTGRGQVVDAAMVDGAASQLAMLYAWLASGRWERSRGGNLLDGSAPFYRTYECADGGFVAVGALEPRFFAALMAGLGIDPAAEGLDQGDRARWPALAERMAAVFATRPRDDWATRFEGTEACVSPVLMPWEAPNHPHNRARGTFVGPPVQPAPGPRLSRHGKAAPPVDTRPDADRDALLARWGVADGD
ncbi:MAG TPA: CaiB/BaiF CoA-transferase family protein [Thermohalobaculum sp.]|nr:CaiB/BaiF CoA-transferase family protein [Thermohalobaculum sp.]